MSIELKGVCYVYSKGTSFEKTALSHINLTIEDGEFIGLIGHTGSGKSTLTQLLNGLNKASSGCILVDGKNIYDKDFSMRDLRSKVGLVFQYPEHQLFEITVRKDVEFGPRNMGLSEEEINKRVEKALFQVGLKEEFYEVSPFELSGGQKRRVAIAGVLAMEPDVLILDEPTAALDPKGKEEILELLCNLQKERGITIILVSHSMEDVAKYVKRILVMNHGELMFDDTPKRVFEHYKELEEIGLRAPQITYIMNELKNINIPVKTDIITIEDAKNEILKWANDRG